MPTKHGVVPAPTKFCVMNRIFFYSVAGLKHNCNSFASFSYVHLLSNYEINLTPVNCSTCYDQNNPAIYLLAMCRSRPNADQRGCYQWNPVASFGWKFARLSTGAWKTTANIIRHFLGRNFQDIGTSKSHNLIPYSRELDRALIINEG